MTYQGAADLNQWTHQDTEDFNQVIYQAPAVINLVIDNPANLNQPPKTKDQAPVHRPPWMPVSKNEDPNGDSGIPYLELCAAALLSHGGELLLADIDSDKLSIFPNCSRSKKK